MSFMYPRKISIYRGAPFPSGSAGLGAQPYREPQTVGNANIWNTTAVFTGITCSIQFDRAGQQTTEDLPGSAGTAPRWKIFIPKSALANGSVRFRDFILDDGGLKYMVYAPYWDSLGYQLLATSLEV